jgi:hypothetical protein
MTMSLGRSADEDAATVAGALEAAGGAAGTQAAPSRVSAPSAANRPDEEEAIVDAVL